LVTVLDEKRVDLKSLSKILGGHLSFGSVDDLGAKMKVKPGSVTPFGLMHDIYKEIRYILDDDILTTESVNFHPLRNDMTIHMGREDFLYLMPEIHTHPQILKIPIIK
jgi:Ala-tRNA(Pro) deacylase